MAKPWFKMPTSFRTDPRIKALTRDQHSVWFCLLCYASEQPERGTIKYRDDPDSDQVLAWAVADGDARLLRETIERIVRFGLFDQTDDALKVHGWDEMQGSDDTTSTERSRRYRQRLKEKGE